MTIFKLGPILALGALTLSAPPAAAEPAARPTIVLVHGAFAGSSSWNPVVRELQAKALVHLVPRVRDIRRLGSCALDLCHVAEGTLDGYFEEGVNLWDHAAGALVAQGAGARVEVTTGAGGGRMLLCAPADGFDELRMLVAASGYLASPVAEET